VEQKVERKQGVSIARMVWASLEAQIYLIVKGVLIGGEGW
jgi:hypothetical protein